MANSNAENPFGFGNSPAEWRQNAAVDYWNQMQNGANTSLQQLYNPYADFMRDSTASPFGQWGQVAYPWGDSVFQRGEANLVGMPGLFNDPRASYTPNSVSDWYAQQPANIGNDMDRPRNIANTQFARGGNDNLDALFNMAGGGMYGQLPGQQGLTSAGLSILGAGGANQGSAGAFGIGQRAGQPDPYIRAGQARGLDLINREALLSPEMAANYAGEIAGRGIRQQQEKVYRDASNRGGGPGSVIGAGNSNQMKADFADEAARANSDARMQALLGQQGLNLQQMGQGASLLNAGNQTDTSRLGVGASAFGTGGQLENQRLGIGADMTGQGLQSQLGYGNLYNSGIGNQNQYTLGMGNLGNTMAGTQNSIFNTGFNQQLQNAGMNLDYMNWGTNRGTGMANAQNGAMGQFTGAFNANMNPYTTLSGQYGQMAGNGLDYAGNYIRNYPSAINAMTAPGNQQGNMFGMIDDDAQNWARVATGFQKP